MAVLVLSESDCGEQKSKLAYFILGNLAIPERYVYPVFSPDGCYMVLKICKNFAVSLFLIAQLQDYQREM